MSLCVNKKITETYVIKRRVNSEHSSLVSLMPFSPLVEPLEIGLREVCFALSEWTTLIVYKWLLKLFNSIHVCCSCSGLALLGGVIIVLV